MYESKAVALSHRWDEPAGAYWRTVRAYEMFVAEILNPSVFEDFFPRPPNGSRGSHCGAAAVEALSCGRDRVRWPVPLAFYPREVGGRVGRV